MRIVVFFFRAIGRIVFDHSCWKGKKIHMGIADRDYMRGKKAERKTPEPRAFIKKAGNRPSLAKRLKFWFWNLTRKD